MRINRSILYISLCAALLSCGGNNKEAIPVLDVTKSYPAKDVVLQDIADVEYLPLETKEGFLLGGAPRIHYIDDEILVTNNQNEVMTFDRRTGRALNSFNRTGRGPGEYDNVGFIVVDRKNGEMFVTQGMNLDWMFPIYVYDMEGKHIRTLRFANYGYTGGTVHIYDNDHLFMRSSDKRYPAPYKLTSKTDTVLTDLPLRFDGRDDMSITQKIEGGTRTFSAGGSTLAKITEEEYLLSEPGVDTIYIWNKVGGEFTPVMVLTPSFHSMEYPVAVNVEWQSRDHIHFRTVEKRWDLDKGSGFKTVKLFYDKNNGQFYEGNLLNADIDDDKRAVVTLTNNPDLPSGRFVTSLQPYVLKELHEEGRLHGKLAELTPSLKDEDNPVLVIITFK